MSFNQDKQTNEMRKKNFLNADGYLIGKRIINPFGQPEGNPSNYQIKELGRGTTTGDRSFDGLNMFDWLNQHGATNQNGTPFQIGNIIRGQLLYNGDIQFKAWKDGQEFTTAWSSDYFIPLLKGYSNEQINSSLLAGYGNYDHNPVGSVAAQAAALAAKGVQFNQAEGDATTTTTAPVNTAPVNPILAPEMITADKKGGMKICLPCTGAMVGLALGLGAAWYVTKHPALAKFHLKNNILQYSVYGIAVGALGYGIGFGINKLKK